MRFKKFGYAIWLAITLIFFAADAFAQYDYEMTLNPRRMGNQVGVEVWVKSLSSTAAPLGGMNIGVTYNGTKLIAEDFSRAYQPMPMTDSIQYEVDATAPLPYVTIETPFNDAAYGFEALTGTRLTGAAEGATRYLAILDVNVGNTLGTGYTPATTGRGTFIGLIRFNILDAGKLTDADLAQFAFNTYTTLNTTTVMSADGSANLTSLINFANPAAFAIRGITVLNPNQKDQTVNRYPETPYLSMGTNHGYPMYFERSGLAGAPATTNAYGTRRFAYKFEYSLNGGTSYTEFGRVAESMDAAVAIAAADLPKYISGDIDAYTNASPYITTGDGSVMPAANATPTFTQSLKSVTEFGYAGVMRVIWKGDDNFPFRSENAKLRITQLDTLDSDASVGDGTLVESNREALTGATQKDESDQTFILGRMFFAQLNGTSDYFRTETNFSTPNQFTVEAWINLASIKGDGTEPGILATSSGSASDEEGGWMLYLKDGKYPAFRARKANAANGEYVGEVVSPVALGTFGSATLTDAHAANWTHLAASVLNNVVTLYVDGEIVDREENNSAVNVRVLNTKMPIWVGVNPNGGIEASDYYHGGIKEARVWRYALSQDQLKNRIAGISDPDGSTTAISGGPNDNRTALELAFPLQGSRLDVADNLVYQNSDNNLNFYTEASLSAAANNTAITYRPDRSHIKLTTPTGREGISNLKNKVYQVRWVAYGIGKPSTRPSASEGDVMIQISRDGGNTWFDALDNAVPAMPIDNAEVETGYAYWEPYNNATVSSAANDLQGVVPVDENYSKPVLMRISGSEARGQNTITSTSAAFTVAPWFAFKTGSDAIVEIPRGTKLNITSEASYFEAWVKPYSFPENTDGNYFPIFAKKDYSQASEAAANHYALRLLPSGQLQFVLGKYDATSGAYEQRTATSDPIYKIPRPNRIEFDSVWFHVGVYLTLPSTGTQSTVTFYVDGVPQEEWSNNTALQVSNPIKYQLGTGIALNRNNTYPTYIGYEPELGGATGKRFDGEIKEVRFWGGAPAGMSTSDNITEFIQGALTVRADELGTFGGVDYAQNLIASYIMNGGSWIANGYQRAINVYPYDEDLLAKLNVSNNYSYAATKPLIKLIEPKYLQGVKNEDADLLVRWVGFDYNRNDLVSFTSGTIADSSDLEFSTFGGGGDANVHYQYTASINHNPGYTNAATLPTANQVYEFPGTSSKSQFAMSLNCSVTDPDLNKDGQYLDQGKIGAAKTNGRLRLKARANINTPDPLEYDNGTWGKLESMLTESSNFNITPPSNFTVRTLLEGYHAGSVTGITANIGDKFTTNGLRIHLFEDNAGRPGNYVANSTAVSADRYTNASTAMAIANRNAGANDFANVPFVFTDVQDGRYFVVVEHQNYLPVMSAFAAPFYFSGDDESTWNLESGWDFQSWNGIDNNYILSTEAKTEPPTFSNRYAAYADESNFTPTRTDVKWGTTGLNYNDGGTDVFTLNNPLPAMVAGDVYRDGQITAADRVQVRNEALSSDPKNDVTGDNVCNAADRTIVDQNTNKVSSLHNLSLQAQYLYPTAAGRTFMGYVLEGDPMTSVHPDYVAWSERLNAATREYLANGGERTHKENTTKGDNTLAGGLEYKVTATPIVKGNTVEIPMYIQNVGADFALANATFAINYDASSLRFVEMTRAQDVIFSSNDKLGYDPSYSAPTDSTLVPTTNTRSIEIDYNAFVRKSGQLVPRSSTYLGTLVFEMSRNDQSLFFDWNKASVVLTTDGKNVTGSGRFEPINPIIVAKTFAVVTPNGGENWEGGVLQSITWTKPVSTTSIFIDYSTDNGSSWNRINSSAYDASLTSYNWVTPKVNSSECLVRLLNANSGLEIDRSDALFSLQASPSEITRPASTDAVYTGGNKDVIRWNSKDAINVRFEYSENGVDNWTAVTGTINSNLGQTAWTLPVANTKRAVVRMVSAQTGEVLSVSSPFKILAGSVVITTPRTGDKVKYGEKKAVRWTYANVNTFTLQYSADGGSAWTTIATDVKANTKLSYWMIPNISTKNGIVRAIYGNDTELEYNRTGLFEMIGNGTGVNEEANGFTATVAPNPFVNDAKVEFTIPNNENVTVELFNSLGDKVATLMNNTNLAAGAHNVSIDGSNLASGVYIVRINAGSVTIKREVVRIK